MTFDSGLGRMSYECRSISCNHRASTVDVCGYSVDNRYLLFESLCYIIVDNFVYKISIKKDNEKYMLMNLCIVNVAIDFFQLLFVFQSSKTKYHGFYVFVVKV